MNNNKGKHDYPQSSIKMRGSCGDTNETITNTSNNVDQGTNHVPDPGAAPVEVGSLQTKEEMSIVLKRYKSTEGTEVYLP